MFTGTLNSIECDLADLLDNETDMRTMADVKRASFIGNPPSNWDVASMATPCSRILLRTSIHHVASHQDQSSDPRDLPLKARLNIICDRLANKGYSLKPDEPESPFSSLPLQICWNGHKLRNDVVKKLREHIAQILSKEYMMQQYKWTSQQFKEADWDAVGATIPPLKGDQVFWTKVMTGWLNTGSQRRKMSQTDGADRCLMCLRPHGYM